MRKGSEEYEYWASNPSPLDDAIFLCMAEGCDLVMRYHGIKFYKATHDDATAIRTNGYLPTYCPRHQRAYDRLVAKRKRLAQEEEGAED